jgi:hypothetical protein
MPVILCLLAYQPTFLQSFYIKYYIAISMKSIIIKILYKYGGQFLNDKISILFNKKYTFFFTAGKKHHNFIMRQRKV